MIRIYDHVLNEVDENFIESFVTNTDFPWYLQKQTISDGNRFKGDTRFVDFPWLFHLIHDNGIVNSTCSEIPVKIVDSLKDKFKITYKEIKQTRMNLMMKTEDKRVSPPHYDFKDDNIDTMIYYINDSDGNTVFYTDETATTIIQEVEPKKGRIVIFPSKTLHAGNRPKEHDIRIVINFNMVKE